jgi:hypothetical protein
VVVKACWHTTPGTVMVSCTSLPAAASRTISYSFREAAATQQRRGRCCWCCCGRLGAAAGACRT